MRLRVFHSAGTTMNQPELYAIREAMELLGKISRNLIYNLLRDGRLASLKIGRRRFIPPHAIKEFVDVSTNTDSPFGDLQVETSDAVFTGPLIGSSTPDSSG
jgi:excisionase family DNA binding protein